jgi:EAL domain-containing protein (putative c-di-GMP-specific phosphodiesterase class I)
VARIAATVDLAQGDLFDRPVPHPELDAKIQLARSVA